MEEKLKQLAQDKAFCQKLAEVGSTEEAIGLFADEGVEMTAEKLRAAFVNAPIGELSETALENVVGGNLNGRWLMIKLGLMAGLKSGSWWKSLIK